MTAESSGSVTTFVSKHGFHLKKPFNSKTDHHNLTHTNQGVKHIWGRWIVMMVLQMSGFQLNYCIKVEFIKVELWTWKSFALYQKVFILLLGRKTKHYMASEKNPSRIASCQFMVFQEHPLELLISLFFSSFFLLFAESFSRTEYSCEIRKVSTTFNIWLTHFCNYFTWTFCLWREDGELCILMASKHCSLKHDAICQPDQDSRARAWRTTWHTRWIWSCWMLQCVFILIATSREVQ